MRGADGVAIEGMTKLFNFSAANLVNATAGAVKIHGDSLRHVYLNNLVRFKYIDIKGERGGPSVMTHGPCVFGGLASGASSPMNNAYNVKDYPVMEMFPKGCEHAPKPSPPPPPKEAPPADDTDNTAVSSGAAAVVVARQPRVAVTAAFATAAAASAAIVFCFA